jgi:uncharacterized delta-60 repeat protein
LSASILFAIPVGAEDPGFDDDGVVITDHSPFDEINDVVIQPDGKIVAAGQTGAFNDEFTERPSSIMVARYNSNGSLDYTFGTGGIVTTELDGYGKATGVALQPDGKIVVAGNVGISVNSTVFAVVRYNTDGSLDETFGFGGFITRRIGFVARISDLAIQSDGKIVVAGEARVSGFNTATLARYNTDGFPDITFGNNGVTQVKPPKFGSSSVILPRGIQLQADQKSVVAGACVIDSVSKFCVARYNLDGSIDNTFGFGGFTTTDFLGESLGGEAVDLAIQPDGKIVAAGQISHEFSTMPVLVRFDENGFPDFSFNGGMVTIFSSPQVRPNAVALRSDGKIVTVGEASFPFFPEGPSMMAVAFHNSDGLIDETLGGIATFSVGTMNSAANAVAIRTDGRIVVAGYANFSNMFQPVVSDFALVLFGIPFNHAPEVTITGPPSGSIFAVNTPVDFTGTFTDDPGDSHVIEWILESSSRPGPIVIPVSESEPGSVHTIVAFTDPGVYKVSLRVTDNHLLSDTATTVDGLEALVVIYDPNGGWVAGGGWIDSPLGAFAPIPDLTGKANFGFVSKYQNGASVPTGNVQFHFNVGNLNFQSTSYEWMVISGGRKAQYKGIGTINGSDSYNFMLTAIDGDQPNGDGKDKFRIRIWSESNGLIYDNQLNAPDSDDPTTVLGGGNVVIHH